MDELDRILGTPDPLEPSAGLADAAMEAIRRESGAPAPLPFPWRRVIPGLGICLGLLAAAIITLILQGIPEPSAAAGIDLQNLLHSTVFTGCAWAAGSLAGSLLITHLSFRLILHRAGEP